MSYQIRVTRSAERDMGNAYDYIGLTLKTPSAADRLLDTAEEVIDGLAEMPARNAVADDPVLASWGIRFAIVMNYLVFYVIDEPTKTVHILRFLYGKRNWVSILKRDFINGNPGTM